MFKNCLRKERLARARVRLARQLYFLSDGRVSLPVLDAKPADARETRFRLFIRSEERKVIGELLFDFEKQRVRPDLCDCTRPSCCSINLRFAKTGFELVESSNVRYEAYSLDTIPGRRSR